MKIALCQLDIQWEDKSANREKALRYIKEAAEQHADLILFPEMSLTGFSMNIQATAEEAEERLPYEEGRKRQDKPGQDMVPEDKPQQDKITQDEQRGKRECRRFCQAGKSVAQFAGYAREYHIAVGLGWVKTAGLRAQNHYTVLGPSGGVLSDYTKLHPFSYAKEDRYFDSGDEIIIFELSGRRIATFICYDLRFPEIFREITDLADIVLIPANWPESRREHWECLLRARAIENQVYVAGINCVGGQNGLHYSGDSCMIDPLGRVVESLTAKEGLLLCGIPDNVAQFRSAFPVGNDRRRGERKPCITII